MNKQLPCQAMRLTARGLGNRHVTLLYSKCMQLAGVTFSCICMLCLQLIQIIALYLIQIVANVGTYPEHNHGMIQLAASTQQGILQSASHIHLLLQAIQHT